MLNCNFRLYTVRRVNWDKRIQYWNFCTEHWAEENEFNKDCIADGRIAEYKAKEYDAELVPLNISASEGREVNV